MVLHDQRTALSELDAALPDERRDDEGIRESLPGADPEESDGGRDFRFAERLAWPLRMPEVLGSREDRRKPVRAVDSLRERRREGD